MEYKQRWLLQNDVGLNRWFLVSAFEAIAVAVGLCDVHGAPESNVLNVVRMHRSIANLRQILC